MKERYHLTWYEWIGWLVNVLMVAIGAVFVGVNFMEHETRAGNIGLIGTLFLVGAWSWILLYFGKGNDRSGSEEA